MSKCYFPQNFKNHKFSALKKAINKLLQLLYQYTILAMDKTFEDEIIKFICCLNKNQLKQANAVMLTLRKESFYSHLVEIYDLVSIMKESQKYIEEQNATLNKQRQRILKLESLNMKQYYKSMNKYSEQLQCINKAEVFDYLTIGNYEKVKDLCKSYKLPKASFLQPLSEFIYFKSLIPIQGGHKIQEKKQELSKEGKLFKALFMKTNQFRKQINHKLSKALFSLFRSQVKQFEQQELPSAFFTSDTKRIFNNIVTLIANLKEVIDKSQQKGASFDNQLPVNQAKGKAKEKAEKKQSISRVVVREEQFSSTNNSTNKNSKPFSEAQQQIQQLKKEIQCLSQLNKALQQKAQILGQENQEERKLVQRYTKQNQALVQKLKQYQISLQTIINMPFRECQDKYIGLVDENAALRAEITLLKKDISEKQGLVSNFEARVAEALRKRKAEHQKQIQKWKKKYAESNLQIDECHEQIQMLNKILEEQFSIQKFFGFKRQSNQQ